MWGYIVINKKFTQKFKITLLYDSIWLLIKVISVGYFHELIFNEIYD